jgi:hypothetical protein
MERQPRWRRAFDRAERTVGKPLEGLVASPRYLNVALFGRRLRGAVGTVVDLPASAVLHLLNLPARGDIRRLDRQVVAVSNEVREVAAGLDQLRNFLPSRKPAAPRTTLP